MANETILTFIISILFMLFLLLFSSKILRRKISIINWIGGGLMSVGFAMLVVDLIFGSSQLQWIGDFATFIIGIYTWGRGYLTLKKWKMKKKKKPLIKEEHPWIILYGMFTNFGLITITFLISLWLKLIINPEVVKKLIPITYLILSIGFIIPIYNSKKFKIGYIIALILGLLLLSIIYY